MIAAMRTPNERLRDARLLRNMTQEELAEAICQIAQNTPRVKGLLNGKMISRWELGQNTPCLFYRKKLCALFGRNPVELGFHQRNPA